MASSVYIHIPFCKKICTYCDFCKVYYNKKWIKPYFNALKKEILERYMDDDIKTIYIGGGTPSVLDSNELKELFKIINIFKVDSLEEFTFECNINDINEELIDILVKNKVNRISIGLESFNQRNLELMGRENDFNDTLSKINLIKEKGINNINVDLIYALPNEKISTVKKDLRLINKLNINHVSTYSLMIEKGTILYNKKIEPINEEIDYKMYKKIIKFLKKHHFNHYEISNFAKTDYESKHNLVYWNNCEYYGFGVGASGYTCGVRYDNTRSLTDYIKGKVTLNSNILSQKEIMDYEIMLGLRKIKGINIKDFYEKYNVNIQSKYEIEKLIKTKDLIYENGYIFINPDKLYVMNEILLKLL